MRPEPYQVKYLRGEDAFCDWQDDLLHGEPPVIWETESLPGLEIGPGLVTLIGGSPGRGKTALTMQLVVDAIRNYPDLRATVANVEMSPRVLLDRQLARLAELDARVIRRRQFDDCHMERIGDAMEILADLTERISFVRHPFSLENVIRSADDFGSRLIVMDYLQRLVPKSANGDKKAAADESMNYLRMAADLDTGHSIVIVSAIGRSRDSRGRATYDADHLGLASFRESSELEFGADDAWILGEFKPPKGQDAPQNIVTCRHLKSRHGETMDRHFRFDKAYQRFVPFDPFEWQPATTVTPEDWSSWS